ncbi:hypothetical protein [Borreliella americana]|uniref:hypothetical protein n=1 Tax=Borreliella americana TaxID=478807 RepID=UPI001E5142C1|nr:hypothetical protein [Borreliella americana]MCD2332642.1 hypothetical protein [Borreliella americana]
MNLIAKLFILTALIYSIIACKLYEKLTGKSQQVIYKLKSNSESFNNVESSGDNSRNDSKYRSLDNAYINQGTDKKHLVADMWPNTQNDTQQVNNDSGEAREAREMIRAIESYTKEYNRVSEELETIKQILDEIKSLVTTARSYLEEARTTRSNKTNKTLLPSLRLAIDKVKSSHTSLNVCHKDAIGALAISKDDSENAKIKAKYALEAASNNSNTARYEHYYYALYYQFMADAKDAMRRAKSSLETAKNKQKCLKNNMDQANKEFDKLRETYRALNNTES